MVSSESLSLLLVKAGTAFKKLSRFFWKVVLSMMPVTRSTKIPIPAKARRMVTQVITKFKPGT